MYANVFESEIVYLAGRPLQTLARKSRKGVGFMCGRTKLRVGGTSNCPYARASKNGIVRGRLVLGEGRISEAEEMMPALSISVDSRNILNWRPICIVSLVQEHGRSKKGVPRTVSAKRTKSLRLIL